MSPCPGQERTSRTIRCWRVLREGARRMLMQAIEAEVEAFLAAHADLTDDQGRRRVVRNGHAPERQIQTGIGPLEVRRPRVRDRGGCCRGADPLHLGYPAGLPAADEEHRGAVALALSEGRVDRPVRGGAGGAARARGAGPVGNDRPAPDRGMAGGARALAGARSLHPPLCLSLGRWRLLHPAARARAAVPAGADRGRRPGPQGAAGDRGRLSRERPELARAAAPAARRERAGASIPSWPPATARSASGRRCTRSGPRPGSNDAGCTRPPTS